MQQLTIEVSALNGAFEWNVRGILVYGSVNWLVSEGISNPFRRPGYHRSRLSQINSENLWIYYAPACVYGAISTCASLIPFRDPKVRTPKTKDNQKCKFHRFGTRGPPQLWQTSARGSLNLRFIADLIVSKLADFY